MDAVSTGSDRPTPTVGSYAHQIFHRLYRRIVKFEVAVYRDTDPEPLHQMRVGMRRMRTALRLFEGVVHIPSDADDRVIRKLGKILGGLRDLDVLGDRLRQDYRPALYPTEQRELDKALKKLAKQRKSALKRVRKMLRGKQYRRFKRGFQAWLDAPIYGTIAGLSLRQAWPDLVQPITHQVLLHPAWLIDTKPGPTGDRVVVASPQKPISHASTLLLHDLRKCIKQQRYQMEFLSDCYPDTHSLADWKTLQECLGQFQDCAVLRDCLATTLGSHWDKRVPNLVQRLTLDEHTALQTWRSLQPRYLNWQVRQALRQAISGTPQGESAGPSSPDTVQGNGASAAAAPSPDRQDAPQDRTPDAVPHRQPEQPSADASAPQPSPALNSPPP
jgi:CHAD domain-containing protein